MRRDEWDSLHRGIIDDLTVTVYRRAWRARPEVRHIRMRGEDAIVKDYGRGGNLFKHLLGAFLAMRERAALLRAGGIRNIPRVLGLPRRWILVLEHIEATELDDTPPEVFTSEFFDQLSAMIADMHALGMAHGDLENLGNILVTPEGQPAIVDFAAAVMAGANPLAAIALPHMQENDLRAVCKAKSVLAPHLLTDEEGELLQRRSTVELWFRRARRYVRRPVKRLAAGEYDKNAP